MAGAGLRRRSLGQLLVIFGIESLLPNAQRAGNKVSLSVFCVAGLQYCQVSFSQPSNITVVIGEAVGAQPSNIIVVIGEELVSEAEKEKCIRSEAPEISLLSGLEMMAYQTF